MCTIMLYVVLAVLLVAVESLLACESVRGSQTLYMDGWRPSLQGSGVVVKEACHGLIVL